MSSGAVATRLPRRKRPAAATIALAASALAAALLARLVLGGSSAPQPGVDPALLAQPALVEAAGVKVVRVAVTGGGGLVDLRYQVVDPAKALAVHDPETPPAIVDEQSGIVIDQPWMSHAGPRALHVGRTYYLLFLNARHAIRPGRSVAVRLGGGRLEHVAVG